VFVSQSVTGNGTGVVRKGLFLLLRLQIVAIFCHSLPILNADHHETLSWRSLVTLERHCWSHLAKKNPARLHSSDSDSNNRWVNNFLNVFPPSRTYEYECVRFDCGITCRPNLSNFEENNTFDKSSQLWLNLLGFAKVLQLRQNYTFFVKL
jgi:hypothetical protein